MILVTILTSVIAVIIFFQIKSGNTIYLTHQIQIDAPPSAVWDVLNTIETVADYNPQVNESHCITENKTGPGASRECTMIDGSVVKERIVKIEPDQAITMELYESNWPVRDMKWRTAVEPKDGGTWVTQTLEYKMKFGAVGAILNSLFLKSKMDSSVQEVFESMKAYVESKK